MLNKRSCRAMGILSFVLVVLLIWWLVTLAGSNTPIWTSWSIFSGLLTLCLIWLGYSLRKDLRQKGCLTLLMVFLLALGCFLLAFLQKIGLSYYGLYDILKKALPANEYLLTCLDFSVFLVLALFLSYVANKLFLKQYPANSIVKMAALIVIVNYLLLFYLKWYVILFTDIKLELASLLSG